MEKVGDRKVEAVDFTSIKKCKKVKSNVATIIRVRASRMTA
jgi:hypothetical protein